MPIWSEARRAGRSAQTDEFAERAPHDSTRELRIISRNECYHCGAQRGLRPMRFDVDGIPTQAMVCRECRGE